MSVSAVRRLKTDDSPVSPHALESSKLIQLLRLFVLGVAETLLETRNFRSHTSSHRGLRFCSSVPPQTLDPCLESTDLLLITLDDILLFTSMAASAERWLGYILCV